MKNLLRKKSEEKPKKKKEKKKGRRRRMVKFFFAVFAQFDFQGCCARIVISYCSVFLAPSWQW
jgi:hypothetical protein